MSTRPRVAMLVDTIPETAVRLVDHVDLATGEHDVDGIIGSRPDGVVPAVSADALDHAASRDAFYVRLFTHHRLRTTVVSAARPADALVRAQTTHKILLMAHSPEGQKRLGRLVATSADAATYLREAMAVLRIPPTRGTHANAMQHMLGYLPHLTSARKHAIIGAIERYATGELERSIPMGMLRAHIRERDVDDWLAAQVYLEPYPDVLRA